MDTKQTKDKYSPKQEKDFIGECPCCKGPLYFKRGLDGELYQYCPDRECWFIEEA